MTPFTFNTIKSLIFEAGAAARLAEVAGQTLGTSVFLVTDPGLRQLGLADPTIASLKEAGHSVAVFDKVEADPSCETLMDAVVSGRGLGRRAGLCQLACRGGARLGLSHRWYVPCAPRAVERAGPAACLAF